ncbi:MAG: GFA family protein [Archangium sp.]
MNTGSCFCGAVKFELRGPSTQVTYCHCSKCRKWHGHFGAFAAVDRADFVFTEQRGLKWHAVSSEVRRGFCGECGSVMFFDTKGDPKFAFTAGSVDEPTSLTSKAHIYVGSKGDYYELADDGLIRRETF